MNSHISVIIKSSSDSLEDALEAAMEPHREVWDDLKNNFWDRWRVYWGVRDGDNEGIKDPQLQKDFSNEDTYMLLNATYVKNLPEDYYTTGVIGLDGNWIDMQDFGWKMAEEPSRDNQDARAAWKQQLKKILTSYHNEICIEVLTHC